MRVIALFLSLFMVVLVSAHGGEHSPPPPKPSSTPCTYTCPSNSPGDGALKDEKTLPFLGGVTVCTYKLPNQHHHGWDEQICTYYTKTGQNISWGPNSKCPRKLEKNCGPNKREPSDNEGLVQARSADVGSNDLFSRKERFQRKRMNLDHVKA